QQHGVHASRNALGFGRRRRLGCFVCRGPDVGLGGRSVGCGVGFGGGLGRGGGRRREESLLAGRDAIGQRLDAGQVGDQAAVTAQRRQQLRQRVVGGADQGHHGGAGRARAVEHAG